MKTPSTYNAAQMIAGKIAIHFEQHLEKATADGESNLASQPTVDVIESIIDVAFWASLRKEEGHSPKISLAYVAPEQVSQPIRYAHKIDLDPAKLSKLAPGVERGGIHIGVWPDKDGKLFIWGTTQSIPNYCLVVDVSEPGLLVVKHRRMTGLGKFTNVAVLKGDQIKIVEDVYSKIGDRPPVLLALLDMAEDAKWSDSANILIQLAVSMRAHGRGGALLVVPEKSEQWKQSIVQPINYGIDPPYCGLSSLIHKDRANSSEIFWQSALRRETDYIGGLTAVDGATIMTNNFGLLAFGAKITRAKGSTQVGKISFSEPVLDGHARDVYPGVVGGTRHLSAAQFIHDQPDTFAMVASQDGHFTIYSWSEELKKVQAQRIDSLLL